MVTLIKLIFGLLADLFRSRASLEAEILVLRQQIIVLRRGKPTRLPFIATDKLVLGWVCRLFPNARDALAIVRPETVVRWHRAGFRSYWRWKSSRRSGRPVVPTELPARLEKLGLCYKSNSCALMESSSMGVTFPNESPEYRAARNKLLQREVALRREMEAVAAEIRALPRGGAVREDYEFDHIDASGAPAKVRLSELFRPGTDTLIIYHYMFPRHRSDQRRGPSGGPTAQLPLEEGPCPSCTALLDN
jgi:hypothetical protein